MINECNPNLSHKVWECACGEGHLSKRLKEYGYEVYSSDKINRGYGEVVDFLSCNHSWEGDIITNPPFKFATQFIYKAMDTLKDKHRAFFFLKVLFLESKERRQLFEKYPPKHVYIMSSRVNCAKGGLFTKGKSAMAYAWYEFEKGYTGESTIKWVN